MTGRVATAVALLLTVAVIREIRAAPEDLPTPRVRMEVSPREATVGDPLEVTLEVVTPPGFRVQRPELGSAGPFTFRSRSWEGPIESDGTLRWLWTGTVAAFETGEIELPGPTIRIAGPEGETSVSSDAVALTIRSVIAGAEPGDDDLAELKGPAGIPPDYRALRHALAVLVGLLLISALAWWLHRRWAHRLAAVPAPEDPFHRMPPHEWVYRELQRLLDRRLAEQGQIDPFFAELSRILKRYLGGRYRVDLMERTTGEVPAELRQAGAPREASAGARALLERADRVKFAGERADPEQCREAVEAVYRIVDATRPSDAPQAVERGAA